MTNKDVLRDRLAAAVDETDRLRAVADRLADTVAHLARHENTPAGLFTSLMAAVREYRKAVSDGR